MLYLDIPESTYFDEADQSFHTIKAQRLTMEHSLLSISKWESKWHIPFLEKRFPKTNEQIIDYMMCMTLTQNVDPNLFYALPKSEVDKINAYIEDPQTATVIKTNKQEGAAPKVKKEYVTSELIYYKMIAYNVPDKFEKWHINRLLTLLQICDIKNEQPKKLNSKQAASQRASLNAARRARLGSRG